MGVRGASSADQPVQHREDRPVTEAVVPPASSTRPAEPVVEPVIEPPFGATPTPDSTARRRRRPNRRLLVPLLGLLVIVGIVGALVLPQFLSTKNTQTVWQSITSGINDGVVPKQTALQAFAYLYKVNIPCSSRT